jgi:cellulose biosynthesis protein BcsQ
MVKLIAIISGKGGVGKTTTAINLGAALNSFGKEVIVVDANLTTPKNSIERGKNTHTFPSLVICKSAPLINLSNGTL